VNAKDWEKKEAVMYLMKYAGTAALLSAALVIGAVPSHAGHSNPVDQKTNPQAENFTDVHIAPRKLDDPFVRDAGVTDPQIFRGVTTGLAQDQLAQVIGQPVKKDGRSWDYQFKFAMTNSQNFLICQYKVKFDREDRVESAIWRRQQCAALAN
jgi:hypothetical protein